MEETLWLQWVEKEKRVASLKKRKYIHFDPKVNFQRNLPFLKAFLNNPKKIAQHSFYPFIRTELKTPRYKKGVDGKRRKEEKVRPIAYAAHLDALIYSWYASQLSYRYESKLLEFQIDDCVIAYRRLEKSNIEFAKEVFDYISSVGECTAMAFDISSFFDRLDHDILKANWGRVLDKADLPVDHYRIYKSLAKYSYAEKHEMDNLFLRETPLKLSRYCTPRDFREKVRGTGILYFNPFKNDLKGSSRNGKTCGIPQGSPLSAVLSNIYMLSFDQAVNGLCKERNALYRRYCDDIIIVCNSEDKDFFKMKVDEEIFHNELIVNAGKTEVTVFRKSDELGLRGFAEDSYAQFRNLQYLGFEFNGSKVFIRSSSLSRYHRRLTARVRESLKATYGKNSLGEVAFKKKILRRYTEKGFRNFVTYASRARKIMNSVEIHKQYKNNVGRVKAVFQKQESRFEKK